VSQAFDLWARRLTGDEDDGAAAESASLVVCLADPLERERHGAVQVETGRRQRRWLEESIQTDRQGAVAERVRVDHDRAWTPRDDQAEPITGLASLREREHQRAHAGRNVHRDVAAEVENESQIDGAVALS